MALDDFSVENSGHNLLITDLPFSLALSGMVSDDIVITCHFLANAINEISHRAMLGLGYSVSLTCVCKYTTADGRSQEESCDIECRISGDVFLRLNHSPVIFPCASLIIKSLNKRHRAQRHFFALTKFLLTR